MKISLIKEINESINDGGSQDSFDASLTSEQLNVIVDMAMDGCDENCEEQEFIEVIHDIMDDVPGLEDEDQRQRALKLAVQEFRLRRTSQ